jgi:hypothetical protein
VQGTTFWDYCIEQAPLLCVLKGFDTRIKRGCRGGGLGRLKALFTPKIEMAIVKMEVEY